MTSFPNFTDPQFVDSNGVGGLNAAFGAVSGSVANAGSGAWAAPGLVSPEAAALSFSGMVGTIDLSLPFGLVSSSGAVMRAHGTLTGQSTTTYNPDFSSLVPATGSVTAYAVATVQQIQQNPFPIPGPPPGHPSYNPSFVPTVGYAVNEYTLAVSATTTAADNVSTFEILRTTLSAGQVSVVSWTTAGQRRAPLREAYPPLQLAAGGSVGAASACYTLMPSVTGLTTTLPPTSGAAGTLFRLVNPLSGNWTIAAAGSDTIAGSGGSVSSMTIPPSGSVIVWADSVHGQWDVFGSQVFGGLAATQRWTGTNTFSQSPVVPNASGATQAAAFGQIPVSLQLAHGECRLSVASSTSLQLSPYNGNNIIIAGTQYQIPAGGITASNSGLTAATLYYAYVINSSGTPVLSLSTTGHITDTTAGNVGIEVKSDDRTHTLVGMVYINSSGQFSSALTANWFNRQNVGINGTGSIAVSTSNTSYIDLGSAYHAPFLTWGGESTLVNATGSFYNSTATAGSNLGIGIDTSLTPEQTTGGTSSTSNAKVSCGSSVVLGLSEGYHYATLLGSTDGAGTSYFTVILAVLARG